MAVDIIRRNPESKKASGEELRDKGYEVGRREYILVTGHRRGELERDFVRSVKELKELPHHPDMDIVASGTPESGMFKNLYTSFVRG